MKKPLSITPSTTSQSACTKGCDGCGKVHLKILGRQDAASRQLHENVTRALALFPLPYKLVEVSEPLAQAAAGVTALPALMMEGQVVVEGRVPSTAEITGLLRDRDLHRSKLYRLRRIAVAVDLSPGSDSALRFAWHIAQKAGASLEAVYVMDKIFNGQERQTSGFLSTYQHTMQVELDHFIGETLSKVGVAYQSPASVCGEPGAWPPAGEPAITSRVLFGFPDAALEEFSIWPDLLVLGTTGQTALAERFFGSISTVVSQRAHCPVLLVPPFADFQGLENILYASNFESLHNLPIRQAVSFARYFGSQVHFVHVGPAGEKGLELEEKLFKLDYDAAGPEHPFVFARMVSDQVPEALHEYAFNHRIDLMVVLAHLRGFWESLLHNSVTRQVAMHAGLPVLVVHSDGDLMK